MVIVILPSTVTLLHICALADTCGRKRTLVAARALRLRDQSKEASKVGLVYGSRLPRRPRAATLIRPTSFFHVDQRTGDVKLTSGVRLLRKGCVMLQMAMLQMAASSAYF